MGVFSNDFATVDVREELCYHSRPEKAKFKGNVEQKRKPMKESYARRETRSRSPSGSAGTAPPAALSIWFFVLVLLFFRGVCLAAARVSAPHSSLPSTRHGAI